MVRHWHPGSSGWHPARPRRRRPKRRGLLGGGELRLVIVIGATLGLASQLSWLAPGSGAAAPAAFVAPTRPVTGPLRVIDGDTFDHQGVRVRIADIDTPELRGECPSERQLARQAKERLRTLLAAGPFTLARVARDEDRYGRKLRIVVRDGRSLGDQLVSEGLARTWSGRREPWC